MRLARRQLPKSVINASVVLSFLDEKCRFAEKVEQEKRDKELALLRLEEEVA
ncbi:hypothetical protein PTT_18006 [Pyrenophora teres f. teres 0-1]|uniref:Uncharacterized protein n=1 Tax=Pyrenophora teres f. teres (strain 0-1) TaxID=861557 RepID=E3S5R4_PYRTT|nr:hypothetical protein PTT_18006 [Pyrenophora teres f. teres 0-1]